MSVTFETPADLAGETIRFSLSEQSLGLISDLAQADGVTVEQWIGRQLLLAVRRRTGKTINDLSVSRN